MWIVHGIVNLLIDAKICSWILRRNVQNKLKLESYDQQHNGNALTIEATVGTLYYKF